MKQQIEAILSGVKDKAINQVGDLWQIRVGARAGARKNGITLAHELLREHREDVGEIAPASPTMDYDAIIRELRSQLAEAKAAPEPEPVSEPDDIEDIQIPAFLREPDAPPQVVDILAEHGLSVSDTYERVNEVLVKRYADAMGNSEYARGNPDGMHAGKSVVEWLGVASRADSGVKWNRGRSVETI